VVPEGYPTDVPVYPGATPGSSMTMPGLGVFATFESDDTVDKIVEHYRTELTRAAGASPIPRTAAASTRPRATARCRCARARTIKAFGDRGQRLAELTISARDETRT
jgi:hypothetical protein